MPGFDNNTMYADNVDFRGVQPVVPQVTADGQLLIGSTATPNIKVGSLTSSDSSITWAVGSGTISGRVSNPVAAAGATGTILRSNGTNWVASTSTYPDTSAINTLVYASAANVLSALATANSGVLTTSTSGVPSIDTTNFHVLSTGVQMKGNNTNTVSPAGFLGEVISASRVQGSATSVNNTPTTVASISLTAGNWIISAVAGFTGTVTGTQSAAAIGTTTNSFTGAVMGNSMTNTPSVSTAGSDVGLSIPGVNVSISITTSYFLVLQANTSVGTGNGYGRISAVRIG